MGKLKTFFSNISNSLKETFKKFPITIIIVYLTTIVCVFGTDDFVETFLDDMWFFMMIAWAIGTLFSEKFFKNNYLRATGEIIALIIAIIMFKVFEWLEKKMSHQEELPMFSIAFALILSYIAELFGISGIIGAYIAGLVVGRTTEGRFIRNKIEVLVHMLFSPIAFAGIGLKISTLILPINTWLFILLFTVVAIISKILGCGLGAKLCKYKSKNALRIGIGMVTRGDIAFIMLHEAKNAMIINEEVFTIVLITLCLATFISPTLLHLKFREDELDDDKKIEVE